MAGRPSSSRWRRPAALRPGDAVAHRLGTRASLDLETAARELSPARRIHIIGGPGAGKSTLARHLGAAWGLPVYTLDTVAYEGPEFIARRYDEAARDARAIAETSEWISEGIFLGWTEPLLASADLIVWLDHAAWLDSAARMLARFFRTAVDEAQSRQGADRFFRFGDYRRNMRHLLVVLRVSREYWRASDSPRRYPVTRRQVRAALVPHARKVVRTRRSGAGVVLEPLRAVDG